ncbi:DUF2150 family protein [Haloquadratum walsbyi]|jgi:Uncharacterized protein conserved in archaea|uniref:Uncharacterized protein conserved in archaea n=1 Tax=Haloquadratum walsbyi J07HQW2 TaxID=1238425 RepID=U1NDL4_9EURY|nr:DUF2150 family protein [Haloquadratum walsbyi]ERG95080.1 MAG: uncharacterized protein conserved in archaea [Haloquadratum walsbyi J07HQW2]
MTEAEETYYTEERWQNWLSRVEEEDLDPENEDSARLLLNLQDDAAIAIAKIVSAFEEDNLDQSAALDELERVREIVLAEPEFNVEETSEDKIMLVDGVQTSLICVFYAAEEYIHGGTAESAPLAEYVEAAADAEADDDVDAALGYLVQAGTRIIAGDELDVTIVDEIEYGLVSEWVNGLDSLQSAMSDPEVVEED